MDVVSLGILGGTFDPVHNGHLALADAACITLSVDRVLFVPAADPPHKQNRLITPVAHRLQMTALAIAGDNRFALSRADVDRPGPHYSVDMVAAVRAEFQYLTAQTCFFIIGADALAGLPAWHKPLDFLQLCRLAVAHRPGYQPDPASLELVLPGLAEKITWIEMPGVPISATGIRDRLAVGQSADDCLPLAVTEYITQHGLYRL